MHQIFSARTQTLSNYWRKYIEFVQNNGIKLKPSYNNKALFFFFTLSSSLIKKQQLLFDYKTFSMEIDVCTKFYKEVLLNKKKPTDNAIYYQF